MLYAEKPGQKRTGVYKQWTKETTRRLERRNLDTEMMEDRKEWRRKLWELFPKERGIGQRDESR